MVRLQAISRSFDVSNFHGRLEIMTVGHSVSVSTASWKKFSPHFVLLILVDHTLGTCNYTYELIIGFCDSRLEGTSGIVLSIFVWSPSFERPDKDFCSFCFKEIRFDVPDDVSKFVASDELGGT